MKRSRAALVVVLSVAALAACGGRSIQTAADSNDSSSGNTVETIAAQDRKGPLTVSGQTLDGKALSTASWRGKVVVLNYWGSWCPPCVKETPDLKAAWEQLRGKNVEFLGLDAQEGAATGKAYVEANGLTYPSLRWDGGTFLLQLKGKAPAPPVTIVLDQQGRLAARVLAPVKAATLVGLVEDVQRGAAAG